mmetsp:Transcript_14640/g.31388  ORF Transcript_14640/g.31388 Transcript_14640/m.31388 type:complete len:96 (+) Transcript_14640:221-508(+)
MGVLSALLVLGVVRVLSGGQLPEPTPVVIAVGLLLLAGVGAAGVALHKFGKSVLDKQLGDLEDVRTESGDTFEEHASHETSYRGEDERLSIVTVV